MQSHLPFFSKVLQAKPSHLNGNPCDKELRMRANFTVGLSWVRLDQQKAGWSESNFCVSCALYIATLHGPFFRPQKFANMTTLLYYVTKIVNVKV